jgi:riboflavin synthase
MFTGLIQAMGQVVGKEERGGGAHLLIGAPGWDYQPRPGDSVCVSGCCLTVVEVVKPTQAGGTAEGGLVMAFDTVAETLAKTTLGLLKHGSRVNLERSLAAGDLMGGHMVQGHIEGVGEVVRVEGSREGGDYRVTIRPPRAERELMAAIVPKGSVTVDGVSLTVAGVDVDRCEFSVALIPTTLEMTTMGALHQGSKVNLETDVVARAVVHWMGHYGGSQTTKA